MKKFSRIISLIVVIATIMTLLTGCGEAKKAEKTVEKTFKALQKLDMSQDFSWDKPAARYMELFTQMCNG